MAAVLQGTLTAFESASVSQSQKSTQFYLYCIFRGSLSETLKCLLVVNYFIVLGKRSNRLTRSMMTFHHVFLQLIKCNNVHSDRI